MVKRKREIVLCFVNYKKLKCQYHILLKDSHSHTEFCPPARVLVRTNPFQEEPSASQRTCAGFS